MMIRKNIFSLFIALVIVFLSFTGAGTFSHLHLPPIPNLDKLVHSIMYFTLTFALIIENRTILTSARKYAELALIPLIFGGVIEVFQSMFTTTRTGDILDFCANAVGITLSVLVWILIKRFLKPGIK
ncbi:MAG: VanZ family protein [Bacteroidales bacterium]|jgi:VanZ family protein